jgi:hypothetical protein
MFEVEDLIQEADHNLYQAKENRGPRNPDS